MTIFNVKVKETTLSKEGKNLGAVDVITTNIFTYYGADNFAPFVLNTIPDQHIAVMNTLEVDISDVFDDADIDRGDIITITAVSADRLLGASVVDNKLRLYGHSVGQTTVTVTATDLLGKSVSDTLTVSVFAIIWVGGMASGSAMLFEVDSATGDVLSQFNASDIPTVGDLRTIASVEYDRSDGTLWFNDNQNPTGGGFGDGQVLYHTELDGTLISKRSTETQGIVSPDGIALDRDGSLWLISNANNRVYNTNKEGTVLYSSFSFGTGISGLALDASDNLWVTDASTDRIYNITKAGATLSSFPNSQFDASSGNVLGIGYSRWTDSLWIQDILTAKIYNIDLQGNLISSFNDSLLASPLNPSALSAVS